MIRLAVLIAALLAGWPALAAAQNQPDDALRGHFAAISAEDYGGADKYFSAAFLRAFKADVAALNTYYIARRQQLAPGYAILSVEPLADKDHEAVALTVEFNDPHPEAPVGVTERMYYYLVREKAPEGTPGRDEQGLAWRIDIYDAIKFDTLTEARRRPYLNTREAWSDDASRELKSRQGLYRIQNALEMFKLEHGQYPFRLLGGDNRRDEMISGGALVERYPPCGFANRPMRSVDFGERSSGDFTYFSLDEDGDGLREGYWLLLHGKVPEQYLYEGHDTILVATSSDESDQHLLAEQFSAYWSGLSQGPLAPAAGLLALADQAEEGAELQPLLAPQEKAPRVAAAVRRASKRMPHDPGAAPQVLQLTAEGAQTQEQQPPAQVGQSGTEVETLQPVTPSKTLPETLPAETTNAQAERRPIQPSALRIAKALAGLALRIARQAAGAAAPSAAQILPNTPLIVHSYGF